MYHPTGITVEIVGVETSNSGRSCDQHDICGSVLDDDVVVRLQKIQILNSQGREETAIAAYLVSDGIDQPVLCWLSAMPTCGTYKAF
jgi:hypothetical protein